MVRCLDEADALCAGDCSPPLPVPVSTAGRVFQPKWADEPLPLIDVAPPPPRPGECRTTLGPYWCERCKEPRGTCLCTICGGRTEYVPQLANLVVSGPALPRGPKEPPPALPAETEDEPDMTRRYAQGTEVTVDRSRLELEKLLQQHGATEFALYITDTKHVVAYRIKGRMVRHHVEMPRPGDFQTYRKTIMDPNKPQRSPQQLERMAKEEFRRRWRGLLLVTKAKLELIASGQSTFEREFLANILLPNGKLVHELLEPAIEQAYLSGVTPKLLLGPGGDGGKSDGE